MPSLPPATVTPASRHILQGGTEREGLARVISATPTRALRATRARPSAAGPGHAGFPQHPPGRHGAGGRGGVYQRHAQARHALQQRAAFGLGHVAQAEAVADRHLALHAVRGGALQDQVEREGAHGARLVQVDVQRRAVALGEGEQGVERLHRVAVDGARVQPAQHVGAGGQRRVQQPGGAGAPQQAGLGKGDDLDLLHLAQRGARAQHAFEVAQAGVGVDVHVRAQARGAQGQKGFRQRHRLRPRVVPAGGAQGALVVDPVDQPGADLVAVPVQAPHRLVEVGVAFDQPGQQQRAAAVLHRAAGGRGQAGAEGGDAAAQHQHVGGLGTQGADVADQQVGR